MPLIEVSEATVEFVWDESVAPVVLVLLVDGVVEATVLLVVFWVFWSLGVVVAAIAALVEVLDEVLAVF